MQIKKDKLRLVVAISDFRIGGAQKVVADLINHLNQNKFDIHLLTFFDSSREENFYNEVNNRVVIHKLNFSSFFDLKSWMKVYKLLKRIDPDIVWSHLFLSNTIVRFIKPLFRYRVITVEHNTYVYRRWVEKITNRILSFYTFKIVAVSEYVAQYTAAQENIPLKKFITIHNGVDLTRFSQSIQNSSKEDLYKELMLSHDAKILLNIGQFIPQKNQALLIEAFAGVATAFPEYRLIILGDGALRFELETLITNLNLQNKVILPGIKKNVAAYYNISDCLIISSKFEGFPIVAIEALASGLPIISTPVSASNVYVSEGINGFISQPAKEALTEAIKRFCSSKPELKLDYSMASKALSTKFDINTAAHIYENLLEMAAKKINI